MQSLRENLTRRAQEIIRDPTCWTHSTAARDDLSRPVSPASTDARTFCGFGAVMKALHERGLPDRWLMEVFDAATLTQLIRANDQAGHAGALASLHALERGF